MPVSDFITAANIKRFRNLLETSVNEMERRTIEALLAEEEAKPALHGSQSGKAAGKAREPGL
jgi:hypothetical protein